MALDFPANPVDGQVFGSYVWLASKSVWQAREESATVAVTSPTAPAIANNGDIWYNTSRGIAYVYYDDGTSSQWVEIVTSGVPSLEEVMPTGSVIQTARATAPTGWALCDGSPLLVANYQALFNAIGYSYGGSGSTFNLPNLKGRVPVGRDSSQTEFDTLGETGGIKSTSLNSTHIPQHSHSIDHDHASFTTASGGGHVHTYFMDDGASIYGGATRVQAIQYDATSSNAGNGGQFNTGGTGNHTHDIDVPAFIGTSGNYGSASVTPVSALQPYIVMNYIIKV
jgi:microcystin-dependent protein